jgi:hypothetical protein
MGYEADEFLARAEECARLAKLSKDEMIQTDLLQLREIYLQMANRLVDPHHPRRPG